MSSLSDSELLKRYLACKDEGAFSALVELHLPMVYGVALRRLRDPASAQEVAQNTFIALAKRAVLLTGHPSLAGWLYRTAIHLSQHHSRKEQRRRHYEELARELGTTMKPDDSSLGQLAPVLDEAMLELRSADREALILRYLGNRPIREVALALGIGEDAAQKRIAKALDRLTGCFRKRGFRVASAAAIATVLQQTAANAMPGGLSLAITHAAVAAGSKAVLPAAALPLLKLMSLTKIQTAAVCLAVAAIPLGYHWYQLADATGQRDQLSRNIKSLQAQVIDHQKEQRWAEHRLARFQAKRTTSQLAALKGEPPRAGQSAFLWDESSPYVPVPRETLSRVRFAPFAARAGNDGKTDRYQLPVLSADGTPQPPLEAALGLSNDESQSLRALCQNEFNDFNQLASEHSTLKEESFANSIPSVKLKTEAFPDEGTQFRNQFQEQLVALLGQERADAFWQQATPIFDELFNGFGSYVRDLQLIRNPNGNLELFNSRPGHSSSIGLLSGRNGMPLPPTLQAYADQWARELEAQSKSQL